jgi:putative transposase
LLMGEKMQETRTSEISLFISLLHFINLIDTICDMEQKYRRTRTTVSLIHYHFVFCPRYRRKVLMNRVEERFKELVADICHENDWVIVAIEVMPDHYHLFLNCLSSTISTLVASAKPLDTLFLR